MSEMSMLKGSQPAAPPQLLACRLRRKEVIGRRGPLENMAEVELENVSAGPLEISYQMTALQYLNLVVTDAAGRVVSEGHFGDRFAPTLEPQILRLEAGARFTADVSLFATLRQWPVPSGTYAVRAVYEYNGSRAVSEPVEVTVEETGSQ
jgi:hypothetical protein